MAAKNDDTNDPITLDHINALFKGQLERLEHEGSTNALSIPTLISQTFVLGMRFQKLIIAFHSIERAGKESELTPETVVAEGKAIDAPN